MTELSRFQKDVEVAANALEMRAENEDAKEEAIHLYRKFGSTNRSAAAGSCCGDISWRKVWRKRNARIMEHILRKGSVRLWNV